MADGPVEVTPEMIAAHIFSKDPGPVGSVQLGADQNNMDVKFMYEVLLTVMMEGLSIMVENLDEVTVDELDADHFEILDPWIQSMGFRLELGEVTDTPANYDCKIMINNEENKNYFLTTNNTKKYHFLLAGRYAQNEWIENLDQLVTVVKVKDGWIKIRFLLAENPDQ